MPLRKHTFFISLYVSVYYRVEESNTSNTAVQCARLYFHNNRDFRHTFFYKGIEEILRVQSYFPRPFSRSLQPLYRAHAYTSWRMDDISVIGAIHVTLFHPRRTNRDTRKLEKWLVEKKYKNVVHVLYKCF